MGAGASQENDPTPVSPQEVQTPEAIVSNTNVVKSKRTTAKPFSIPTGKFVEPELPQHIAIQKYILPVENILHICHYLPSGTLVRISQVCQGFASVCNSSKVWAQKCAAFGEKPESYSWKLFYRAYSQTIQVTLEDVYDFCNFYKNVENCCHMMMALNIQFECKTLQTVACTCRLHILVAVPAC